MTDNEARRIEHIERLAKATAELAQLKQELISDLAQELAAVKAELAAVKATALGASYLGGAAL